METKSNSHLCVYCNRHFRFKDTYDQHHITCEFLFKSKKEKDRENDVYEFIPSSQDQYKFIQYLASQVVQLKKEVEQLKGITIIKRRKVIHEWLNSNENYVSKQGFLAWSKSIPIEFCHLNTVFEQDLMSSVKECLKSFILDTKNPPIQAFTQKQNTIYIMNHDTDTDKRDWTILSNDTFDQWIDRILHQYLHRFIQWQQENMARLQSSETGKDKYIEYMQKINGLEERKRSELRKWLFSILAKDMASASTFEFIP